MATPFALRRDIEGAQLRTLVKQTKDAAFARRMLMLAEIYEGGSRPDAPALAASVCKPFAIGFCTSTFGQQTSVTLSSCEVRSAA